jgi:hypothetical protein
MKPESNMNTNVKPQTTVILWKFAASSLAVCLLSVALLGAAAVGFAQAPSPTPSPFPTENPETQINTAATEPADAEPAATLSADELASLVGPIALYPDPLLFQVLAASTYPLEVIQLKQWMDKNKKLNGKALADAVTQQNWDPSVQALSAFPAVVDKLANDIQWTTDLGNAFLAQQNDVMDSVQDLRATAEANGALRSNDKQNVGTETTNDGKQAITIESAQRDVVYVPSYNTQYVYRDSGNSDDSSYSSGYSSGSSSGYSSGSSDGDYSYLAYAAGAATGVAYGYYNWRDGSGYTNGDNYYVKNSGNSYRNNGNNYGNNSLRNNGNNYGNNSFRNNGNNSSSNSFRNNANNVSQSLNQGSGKWQHDPSHRGSTPYSDRNLANQFGQGNNRLSNSSLGNQASQLRQGNPGKANAGNQLVRANGLSGAGARQGMRAPNTGAANRIGNRAPSNWPGGGKGGAFSAPKGDFARAASARGAQSVKPPGGFRGGPPRGGGGFRPPMGGGGPPMGGGMPGPPPAPPGP